MAELSEGTYVILSIGSTKAIDVSGGSSKSGTNVIQWNYSAGDNQIWAFTKPNENEDIWQIICSLTGKTLDVASIVNGGNVRQFDDTDDDKQRWTIVPVLSGDTQKTFTYSGKTYPVYRIQPFLDNSFSISVANGSTAAGANIQINTTNTANTQQWIFIPVPSINSRGTYQIRLAADTKMCLDIAGASTSNGANVDVWTANDVDWQIFRADVDPEDFTVQFINANSHRAIGVKTDTPKAGTNVQQFTLERNPKVERQTWLLTQLGSVKIDSNNYPTYILRLQAGNNLCLDCMGGGTKASTNIGVWTRSDKINQRFVLYKTDRYNEEADQPGAIQNSLFILESAGTGRPSNLQFASNDTKFQARYCIKRYKSGHITSDKTVWKNLYDGSTSNSGWGDAWAPTFEAQPQNGTITIPDELMPSVVLNTTYQTATIEMEIRAFDDDFDTGFAAHGPSMISTINIVQKPVISISSMRLVADQTASELNIETVISDNLGNGCERVRARLLGSDGIAISRWVSGSSMTIDHNVAVHMLRLPNDNESITLEYSYLSPDGVTIESSNTIVFSYGANSPIHLNPELTYLADDSYCVTVRSSKNTVDYCLIEEFDEEGIHLTRGKTIKPPNQNTLLWKCAPTLNREVRIIVLSKSSTSQTAPWSIAILTCFVKSRAFVWHWQSDPNAESFDTCALVYLNVDNPPSQTRNYSTNTVFQNPIGRTFPIAFSSKNLDLDLSLDAVVLDDDANYTSSVRLLNYSNWEYVRMLSKLAGKGIHPYYRSPYGDAHHVAIESVSGTKDSIGYTRVSIKQRAVEE